MTAEAATAGQMQVLTVEQVSQIAKLADIYAARLRADLGADPDPGKVEADVLSGTAADANAVMAAIDALSREARYELIALVWCGMGEYSFTEARAYSQATSDKGTAAYITKKSLILSGLLRTALATLGQKLG